MKPEQWRPVPGYESRYAVSSFGRIFSFPKGRQKARYITGGIGNHGYVLVTVRSRPNKHELAHRWVALAFVENPEGLPFVNHKDSNRSNNRVENLEWCNNSQNIIHAVQAGRMPRKLTEAQVREIRACGGLDTPTATRFGVSQVLVTKIRAGKVWAHLK